MDTYISVVHSLSGRRTGVIILSDDQTFIRESMKLTDAIKAVYGGDRVERVVNKQDQGRDSA